MAKYLDPVTGEFTDPTGGETWTPEPVPVPGGSPTGDIIEPPKSGTGSPETPQLGPQEPGNDMRPDPGQFPELGNQQATEPPPAFEGNDQRIDPGQFPDGTVATGGVGNLKNDLEMHNDTPGAGTSAGYANITGLDTAKLNDPNKNDVKYGPEARAFALAVGRTNAGNGDPSLSATDPASQAIILQRLKAQGYNASFNGDKLDFGNGTVVDVMLNSGQGGPAAGKGWAWLPQQGAEAAANGDDTSYRGPSGGATHASAAPAGAGRPAPPAGYDYDNGGNLVDAFGHPAPGSVSGGGSPAAAPQGASAATSSPYADQIRQLIMARLGELGKPVDENDPQIAQAVSAARDEATRQTDTERTALAERLYGQGGGALNSGELGRSIQQSAERNATGIGSLRAKLITQQYAQKQGQLQQLLQSALQSGDAESARQVQLQMSALDAELRREGLTLDAQLRREGFGINLAEFGANLNQQAALAGLNG